MGIDRPSRRPAHPNAGEPEMRKLTLTLDELAVVSFETVTTRRERDESPERRGWSDESVCPTVTNGGARCPY
jgi:hypothetical protein